MAESSSLLVLGLGNILCGDDGLGVAAVEEICRRFRIAENVRVLDGGTLGLTLLSFFEDSQDVILVDAVAAAGQAAGSFVRLEGDDVAPAVRNRLSVHQIGVADLLDALRLIDAYPSRLVLLGLVPETLELGLERSPAVEENMFFLVDRVIQEANRLGYEFRAERDEDETAVASPCGAAAGAD